MKCGKPPNFTPIHARDIHDGYRVAVEAFEAATDRGCDDELLADILALVIREHRLACAAEFANLGCEGSA